MKSKLKNLYAYGLMQSKKINYLHEYTRTSKRMIKHNPINKSLFNKDIEQAYKEKWSPIAKNPPLDCFKIYSSIYNKIDLNFVSGFLHAFIIKGILTDERYNIYYEDKNLFEKRLPEFSYLFPKVYFRRINGVFYDNNYDNISNINSFLKTLNHENMIVKESINSAGGRGVLFFNKVNSDSLYETKDKYSIMTFFLDQQNFVAQEIVSQSSKMAQLNKTSINTVRVLTYRSVTDNSIKVTQSLLRKGEKNSYLDNWHSGGIIIGINDKGKIANHGYNYNFEKIYHHTKEFIVPQLNEMYDIAKEIAKTEFHHRTLSFDFCIDKNNKVKIIEINYGLSSFFQMISGPLFGEYTDEVIDYCKSNIGHLNINTSYLLKNFR